VKRRVNVSARAQGVERLGERGHDGVADGLDDCATVFRDDGKQLGEVALHFHERGGIPALCVHRRRAHDVGEENGLLSDGELNVGAKVRLAEEIAEVLKVEELRGAKRVVAPA